MKKLIAIIAVACILVFSCVPAFAEGQYVEGYAVDDVPYNDSADGVLTASDDGSQLYSASSNRTYNTPAVLSAPSTSSSAIYSYKSVTQFIPTNIWRGSNSPTVSFPVSSTGYTGIKYVWASNDDSQSFYHYTSMKAFSNLQGGRKYRVTFTVSFSRSSGSFVFYLANRSSSDSPIINLLSVSETINMSNSGKSVSIDFTLPEGSIDVIPVIKGTLYQSGNASYSATELTFYVNDFTIIDITTEDLDKSLDKFGDRIDNIINPSEDYSNWNNGDVSNKSAELGSEMNKLPTVDYNEFESMANSIDLSEFSNAFASINQLFIRIVDTVGVTPLIFFALFFGICIFLIGRKLSGG